MMSQLKWMNHWSIWIDLRGLRFNWIRKGGGKMRSGPPEMELLWYGGFRWSKMFTFAVDNEHVCVSPVVVKQNRLSVTFGADVRIHLAGCCNIYLTIPSRNSIPTDVFTVRTQTKQWGWWFLPIFIFINIFKVLLSQSRRFPGTTCSIIFIWEWLSHHNCNWIRGLSVLNIGRCILASSCWCHVLAPGVTLSWFAYAHSANRRQRSLSLDVRIYYAGHTRRIHNSRILPATKWTPSLVWFAFWLSSLWWWWPPQRLEVSS